MIEEEVQKELGHLMPVMGPERWEVVKQAIAEFTSRRVNDANNRAQAVVFQTFTSAMRMNGARLEQEDFE